MSCAEVLGSSDFSVAVLDRLQQPGVKACGGGITPNPKLYWELPGKYREFRRHLIIINQRKFEVEIRHPVKVVDRADLADYQIARIRSFGNIRLFRNIKVESISANPGQSWVNTEEGNRVYFDYLVGADGAGSVTRSFLGLETDYKTGMHYRVNSEYDRMTWYFNPELLGEGYCWIFPNKNYLSCGALYRLGRTKGREALRILNDFLDERGLNYYVKDLEGAPVNFRYEGFRFGRVFLCGDAAGVAFPASGEGIYPAVLSGEAVGRYLMGDSRAFSALNPLLRSRKRQIGRLKLFRALRNPRLQSMALEGVARLGSRHYKS